MSRPVKLKDGRPAAKVECFAFLSCGTTQVVNLQAENEKKEKEIDLFLQAHLETDRYLFSLALALLIHNKLQTASLQLQEFCQRNQIVDSTTSAARLSLPS